MVRSALFHNCMQDQSTSTLGLLDKLKGKSNISVMADRGFTVRDQLNIIGFMEGRGKLPASEVLEEMKDCFFTHSS